MNHSKGRNMKDFLLSRTGLALIAFLGVAGYFLWTEHQAHVITALPFVLVGGCIVMHLFMHGGHGHAPHGVAQPSTSWTTSSSIP